MRVYQFRHFGSFGKVFKNPSVCGVRSYFFVGCGELVITVENGVGVGPAVVGEGWGVGDAPGTSGMPDCKTDLVPLTAGNDRLRASNMKAAAAPIVIFASKV